MPQNYPLSIYRGDTHRWQFTLWADSGKTQPADLTGVTVEAWIGKPGTLTCAVAANVITVTLTAASSSALSAGRWDLQLTYPSGDVQTIVAGDVSVRADVTGATAA